jgi:cardiolipin synthase
MNLQPPPVRRASSPARAGNDVRILVDGVEAFTRISTIVLAARSRVWITVSFVDLHVHIPGAAMTFLELVDSVAARGIDVRLLFWWSEFPGIGSFRGDDHEIKELAARDTNVRMRWDHIRHGCHHQKTWVVDGTHAFVGGINITEEALSEPSHTGPGFHDVFCEVEGSAAADVAANFIDRWNQASITRERGLAFPSIDHAGDLDEPVAPDAPTPAAHLGDARVQIVRTIPGGLYTGTRGWHAEHRFDLGDGETSVCETTHAWIESAERSIYIENQFLMDPATIRCLRDAAERGVEVIAVVPGEPDPNLLLYPKEDMERTRTALTGISDAENLGLFALTHTDTTAQPIYVHSKLMIVDDRRLMLGSANIWPPSFTTDSELDVCVWDSAIAKSTRARLWREHLCDAEVAGLSDWRRLEAEARRARSAGDPAKVRILELNAERYYEFSDDSAAPWHGVEERG